MKKLIFTLLLIGFIVPIFAQKSYKRVNGIPIKYLRPHKASGLPTANEQRSKSEPWLVFCDRDQVKVYEKPNQKSNVITNLKFLSRGYYVVDETDDMIKIISAVLEKGLKVAETYEDLGWVRKDKMLLHNRALLNAETLINEKVWVLLKDDSFKDKATFEERNKANIYSSPDKDDIITSTPNYNYYFVYKYSGQESAQDKILIGSESKINNPITGKTILKGWIDINRVAIWSTRLCFEANYDQNAFEERQRNEKLRLILTNNEYSAQEHAIGKNIPAKDIILEVDPATNTQITTKNNRRLGSVIRFPVLKSYIKSSNFVYSAAIGEVAFGENQNGEVKKDIEREDRSSLEQYVVETLETKKIVNVHYVLETNEKNAIYKDMILKSIDELNQRYNKSYTIKCGLTSFKNYDDGNIETIALNADLNQVKSKIAGLNFNRKNAQSKNSVFRAAVYDALLTAGFSNENTNVMIIIGENADVSESNALRKILPAKGLSNFLIVEDGYKIYEKIGELGMHIKAIQASYNDVNKLAFARECRNLILQSAIRLHDKNVSEDNLFGSNPRIEEIEASNNIAIQNGYYVQELFRPNEVNYQLNVDRIKSDVNRFLGDILEEYVVRTEEKIQDVIIEGESIENIGTWSKSVLNELQLLIRENFDQSEADALWDNLKSKRFEFYRPAFFPYQITGAENPLVKPVLFMPQEDLENHRDNFNIILSSSSVGSMKDNLFEGLVKLHEKYSGDTNTDMDDISIEDINKRIIGLEDDAGISIPSFDFKIGDIYDLSPSEVERIVESIRIKSEHINNMLVRSDYYEFKKLTPNGNLYFWIPVDDAILNFVE